jgi:hypothetical protein
MMVSQRVNGSTIEAALTVLVDDQHPRLSSGLILFHNVGNGVLAIFVESNVDLSALIVDSGDHYISRGYGYIQRTVNNNRYLQVFSEMLLK